ncbi:hypothetical protein BX600DRAFT_302073 [Xylariales sp. PMI_506]|nr:hypothetical protein BX600DRAFT_302073 [Xylariales sp. PMI_506]
MSHHTAQSAKKPNRFQRWYRSQHTSTPPAGSVLSTTIPNPSPSLSPPLPSSSSLPLRANAIISSSSRSSSQQPYIAPDNLFEKALKQLDQSHRTVIERSILSKGDNIDTALVQTIAVAKVAQQRCLEKKWTWTFSGRERSLQEQADKVVAWLDRFKAVGDIAANVDPLHVGLPWAGLRLLLEV